MFDSSLPGLVICGHSLGRTPAGKPGGEVVTDGGDRPGGEHLRQWQGRGRSGLTVGEAGGAAPASPHPCGYLAIGTGPRGAA